LAGGRSAGDRSARSLALIAHIRDKHARWGRWRPESPCPPRSDGIGEALEVAATRQRAMILLASNTLMSAPKIARMLLTDESHVRKVIHDFNQHGFDSLRPRFGGGRPRRISTDDEQRIVAVACARPDTLGVPYTRWSLAKPRYPDQPDTNQRVSGATLREAALGGLARRPRCVRSAPGRGRARRRRP
jgi:transposase